jgi:hypothetical protein
MPPEQRDMPAENENMPTEFRRRPKETDNSVMFLAACEGISLLSPRT